MSDLTTQADRALAHRWHYKEADGAATDWIEGREPFESDEIEDDVRDLAIIFAEVRRKSNARVADLEVQLAAERERSGDAEARYTASIRAHEATAQEHDALRADLARVTQERDGLTSTLVSLFDWSDTSYIHAAMHVENAVRNLRADLAVLRTERDAALSRVAALEAAVTGFFVESRGEGQRVQYVEHERPMSFSEREWNRHLRALRDALSGGTAALDAHDAALMDRVRARVEALKTHGRRWVSTSDGSVIYRADIADVLAALAAKGGA